MNEKQNELLELRKKAIEIQKQCEELKSTNLEVHAEYNKALQCLHEIRQFAIDANPENYTTEQYSLVVTELLLKYNFIR